MNPTNAPADDLSLDAPTIRALLLASLQALSERYVFPDVAAAINAAMRPRIAMGAYDHLVDANGLCDRVTEELQAIAHDKHLRLRRHERTPADAPVELPPDEIMALMRHDGQHINYGFAHVERLAGNIGYLDVRTFFPPIVAGETAAHAMGFLENAAALIIDLRNHIGGRPEMGALLASYLFEIPPEVHLSDIYNRIEDSTLQFWTFPYVPGKRDGRRPVYLLTSAQTFSAGEGFAYALQQLKRATVVGEVTKGGAHATRPMQLNDHFEITIPYGRSINPITQTNWEGVGVQPDVRVAASQALDVAHRMALEQMMQQWGSRADIPHDLIQEAHDALKRLQHASDTHAGDVRKS